MHRDFVIETAAREDAADILFFIRQLAVYEHLENEVVTDEAQLAEEIFDKGGANVVFIKEGDKRIGFALYFFNFSTFLGRPGLYLEDLFVLPEHRGKGAGRALLRHLAGIAKARGCGRMEWSCLDWNKPSIEFYRSMGAVPMEDWTVYRLTGATLDAAAE